MNGLEKLRLRMHADGNSLKQDKINTSIRYINDTFQDDPTYQTDGIQIIDGNMIYPRIWNYKKDDNLSPTVEIQTRITEEFKRGQLLRFNDEHWLCLKSLCFHGMYWTGKLKQCTHLLYYQNVKTRAIESSWAVLERPYSKTLNNGQVITTSEMEFKAMLPFNESTKKINLDRRLLTGTEYDSFGNEIGSVYKITGRNGSSQVINGEGFLVLNMEQVQFNKDKDNLELMIADYIPPESPTSPIDLDPTLLNCEIIGSSTLRCGGSARTFKAIFYQVDGTTHDNTIPPVWDIYLPLEYRQYQNCISTSKVDNLMSITINNEICLIGCTFNLSLRDARGLYNKTEIKIKITSAF